MEKISRRDFLQLGVGWSGAVLATGLGVKSAEHLLSPAKPPEDARPGMLNIYATTCRECPAGCGMHVWHRDGRATKAEGNPAHPISRGGLCARGQSSLQGLYDPDRVREVLGRPGSGRLRVVDWKSATKDIGDKLHAGGQVKVMSGLETGALSEVQEQLASAFGGARVLYYEPFNYEGLRSAHEKVFGSPTIPHFNIEGSSFVISFGADFLETWVSPVGYARQFAEMHRYHDGAMGRMVYVGPRLSMTAANADEFIQVSPGGELWVAAAMLREMIARGWTRANVNAVKGALDGIVARLPMPAGITGERIAELARAFYEAEGSVALAGASGAYPGQSEQTPTVAALLNYAGGRVGQTVDFSRPHALSRTARESEVREFLAGLRSKDVLIINNCNPVYARSDAAEQISRAGTVVYLGTMQDETAALANWVLPIDSPLESWGEYEPVAGVRGLVQPAMSRIWDTRGAGDVLLEIAGAGGKALKPEGSSGTVKDFKDWLQHSWAARAGGNWRESLRAGGAWTKEALKAPAPAVNLKDLKLDAPEPTETRGAGEAKLWLWPSIMMFDGRTANRGWLQEAPDPTTYLAWGSCVEINPHKAEQLGVKNGDVVEVSTSSGKVEAPAWVTADIAEDAVGLAFGQGHDELGRNAASRGANAFRLVDSTGKETTGVVKVRATGRFAPPTSLSATQDQYRREIIQWVGLSELSRMKPGDGTDVILPLPEGYRKDKDIYRAHEYPQRRWAMVVDLARCTGCGACAVACYAENNVAVMGESSVGRGLEMAWLHVVPYRDDENGLRVGFIPMMCQQCDAAPCEPVCPVFASVHNDEGLNAQVYNRCIGTRYCSNNCPYKVRRFNWLNVTWERPLDWQLNPEVTVRVRGVMEKCSFCVQRIRGAEHRATVEGRQLRDGEVAPACVQSCPTQAYTFGDLMDPKSRVSELTRRDPRRYHVLEELNTKPAVTYLRRVKREA